ncbi:MAG: hypothetical protein C0433_12185 [Cyclobacterium sp.]|nr:hypothetical protein [Cyclobacterium sp.]
MTEKQHFLAVFWVANLGFAIAKILLTFRPELDLFTEEAQYWLWAQNMDWHYYSKPPMVAVLNFLSTGIFGDTEFAVRFTPIVFGLATAWIVYSFAFDLYKSEKTACLAGLIFLGMPIHLLEFTFHTTDTSMTFFWTLSWYLLYRAIFSELKGQWIIAGLITALGIMSKLTMVLIFPASLFFLVYSGKIKSQFIPWLWFAGIAFLGFLPSLIWNIQNDFYTFKHLAALGGVSGTTPRPFDVGLLLKRTSEYFGGQLAMVSVFFLPFFFYGIKKLTAQKDYTGIYLVFPGLLTFLGFGGLSLFTFIEVNWPGFTYSTFPVFLAPLVAEFGDKWKRYSQWALAISLSLPFLFYLPNFLRWKSQGPIFSAEKALFKSMIGYEDLGNRIDFLRDSLEIFAPVIFSESYHVASELAFYIKDHPQTFTVNMGSRKNQWDLWPGMDQFVGKPEKFIFVSRNQASPEAAVRFEKLLFEEERPFLFGKDTLGKTKIQVWENLLEYNPKDIGTY